MALVTSLSNGGSTRLLAAAAASEDDGVQQIWHKWHASGFSWVSPTPPTTAKPTSIPTRAPTLRPTSPCTSAFTVATYDAIDDDIASIKENILDDESRSRFLGGILRLAAHDFMDFDPRRSIPMGPDGCFDENHATNAGLERVWCDDCGLTLLYRQKYAHVSRADFWIAAANAVIRLTSVDNALDLKETFRWGRRDRSSCGGTGARLPGSAGCADIEEVLVARMGLRWKDAAALMGAHTLGGGNRGSSGHHGSWVGNNQDAQVFDRQYYLEITDKVWRPRNQGGPENGGPPQDWTTGRNNGNGQMMLNTDICLAFDIDQFRRRGVPCCSRTDKTFSNGENECIDREAARSRCPRYSPRDPRRAATDAVYKYVSDNDNTLFYEDFAEAWQKATTVGQRRLHPLAETCELV